MPKLVADSYLIDKHQHAERFRDASMLMEALQRCTQPPVVFVLDGPTLGFLLSAAERDELARTGATILYQRKQDLQAQIDADPQFEALSPAPAMMSDHAAIDRIYGQVQNITRALLQDLIQALDAPMRHEAAPLAETVALKSADCYAPTAIAHAVLLEIMGARNPRPQTSETHTLRPLFLLGRRARNLHGLCALLKREGIVPVVFQSGRPPKKPVVPVVSEVPIVSKASVPVPLKQYWKHLHRAVKRRIRQKLGIEAYPNTAAKVPAPVPPPQKLRNFHAFIDDPMLAPVVVAPKEQSVGTYQIIDRICAETQPGDQLCMVHSDSRYLRALRPILDGAPGRISVIVSVSVRSDSASDLLTEIGTPDPERLGLAHLASVELRLQDRQERDALQTSVIAWTIREEECESLSTRLGWPIGFVLFGLHETLNLLVNAIVAARIYRGVLDHTRPSAILAMPQRILQSRVLADVARTYGIPTFDLPVGTMARSRIQWRTGCDHIFVADTGSYRTQTEFFGLAPERVQIIGAPYLDASVADLRAGAQSLRPPHSVFLALQHLDLAHSLKLISACARATRHLGGTLTVGLHPRELERTRAALMAHCQNQGAHVRLAQGPSLPALVHHETCVTFYSFIAYEAYALGTRVVTLNLSNGSWPVRLAESGIAEEACSEAELIALLQKSPDQTEIDARNAVLRDGGSVQRLHRAMATLRPVSRETF